jgi:hypothetical protein
VVGLVAQELFMKRTDWMFLEIFANTKNLYLSTGFLNYTNFKLQIIFALTISADRKKPRSLKSS